MSERTKAMSEPGDKKSRIVQAAMEVFSEKPYHQVTMEEISGRAGVGKGTIYEYFRSKDSLFADVADLGFNMYLAELAGSIKPHESATAQLKALFTTHLRFVERHVHAARLLSKENRPTQSGMKQLVENYRKKIMDLLSEIIRLGVDRGEFRPADIVLISGILMGALTSLWISALFNTSAFSDMEATVEELVNFFLHGLAKRPAN